ncbi:MAG: POTRA domain-containing protein [Silvanigrellaceae bacterium]
MSVCSFSASAADAYEKNEIDSRPRVQFILDGTSWDPPSDLLAILNELPASDISNAIIHVLFERLGLQNIVVSRVSQDGGGVLQVTANRLPRVGEVAFRGLNSAQIRQVRVALKTKVGLPFIVEEAERDREAIRSKLAERGYLMARVDSPEAVAGLGGELKVVFPVSLETPCRIAEIKTEPDESFFDYFTTPIELGSLCDKAALEEVLERQKSRLLADGYFDSHLSLLSLSISADRQRASLKIRYVRGPKTRIEVLNRQTGIVTDVVSEFREKISAYDVLNLSDEELRAEVRREFFNRGFATAVVTGPVRVTDPNGDTVVRFFVQTGPLIVISDTQFIGELPLPRQEVVERLDLIPGVLEGSVPFVEDSLPRYRDKLVGLYLDEGFAEAAVADPVAQFSPDGRSVKLVFEVKAGYRSVLRDVTILGRPVDFNLTKSFQEKTLQPGQPLNAQILRNLEDEVRLELMNAGYAYASIQVVTKSLPPVGLVRPIQVTVDLNPGPLVRIGKIYAEGDSFGKQERIIIESGLRTGDIFSPDGLEQCRARILKHDLFDTVIIEPISAEALERRDSVLDLVIRLTAKRSYSLGLSPSYGTRSGYRFNVDFAKNNLSADGLRFTSALALSQEKLQSSVFSNQRIMGRKVTIGLMEPLIRFGSYVSPLDWSIVSGLEVSAQSLSDRYFETLDTGFAWRPQFAGRSWTVQSRVIHEWSKAFGEDLKPLEALDRPTVKIREFLLAASFDSRDNVEWPVNGMTFDVVSNHARFGLLSDVRYDRYSVDTGFFFPIYRRLSGAINLGGIKVSDVVNAQAVAVTAPSSRRATLAGRSTVRGFPEASSTVTPGPLLWLNFVPPQGNPSLQCQPTVKPIGATNVLYAKSEVRLRSPWLGESLGFAGFLDSGAAFFTGTELQTLQTRLKGEGDYLDPGSEDQCALKAASVVGDGSINLLSRDFFKDYSINSYFSAGAGIRYIISNFASINVDVGFPLHEPQDAGRNEKCINPSDVAGTSEAPACVKRRSTSRLFGLFPVPGAYHIGIGANF